MISMFLSLLAIGIGRGEKKVTEMEGSQINNQGDERGWRKVFEFWFFFSFLPKGLNFDQWMVKVGKKNRGKKLRGMTNIRVIWYRVYLRVNESFWWKYLVSKRDVFAGWFKRGEVKMTFYGQKNDMHCEMMRLNKGTTRMGCHKIVWFILSLGLRVVKGLNSKILLIMILIIFW